MRRPRHWILISQVSLLFFGGVYNILNCGCQLRQRELSVNSRQAQAQAQAWVREYRCWTVIKRELNVWNVVFLFEYVEV